MDAKFFSDGYPVFQIMDSTRYLIAYSFIYEIASLAFTKYLYVFGSILNLLCSTDRALHFVLVPYYYLLRPVLPPNSSFSKLFWILFFSI